MLCHMQFVNYLRHTKLQKQNIFPPFPTDILNCVRKVLAKILKSANISTNHENIDHRLKFQLTAVLFGLDTNCHLSDAMMYGVYVWLECGCPNHYFISFMSTKLVSCPLLLSTNWLSAFNCKWICLWDGHGVGKWWYLCLTFFPPWKYWCKFASIFSTDFQSCEVSCELALAVI